MRAKSPQSRPTLCDPMDHSPPGSSVHGILQARILEWVAVPSSRGLNPRLSCLLHWQAGSLSWAPPGKPLTLCYLHPVSGAYLIALSLQTTSCSFSLFTYQKEGAGPQDGQTQLLGYWCQPMTVFETVQEEEYKILTPSLLITDPWLQALIFCKPTDSSWSRGGTALEAWAYCVSLSACWELKPPFYFLQTLSPHFFIWIGWAEKAKILASNSHQIWSRSKYEGKRALKNHNS